MAGSREMRRPIPMKISSNLRGWPIFLRAAILNMYVPTDSTRMMVVGTRANICRL